MLVESMEPALEAARVWTSFAYRAWTADAAAAPRDPLDAALPRRLGIAPLLYTALREVDDDRASRFAAEYRHAMTANLIRLTHGAHLRDALERRGVPAILLKGGAFLVRFCPKMLGARPMADLDLLVSTRDYRSAQQVLRREGFEPSFDQARPSMRVSHAASFVGTHAPLPVEIDLHRAVARWPAAPGLTDRILRAHDRVDSWRVPSLPEAFAVTALHRARHAFVWSAFDLFELKRTGEAMDEDQWRAVFDLAASAKLTGAIWAAYRQALWWLGAAPEEAARLDQLARRLNPVRRRMLERIADPAGVLLRDSRWQVPLLREAVVGSCAVTTTGRALLAGASFLPLRFADEWAAAANDGLSASARLRRLWEHIWHGGLRQPTSPDAR